MDCRCDRQRNSPNTIAMKANPDTLAKGLPPMPVSQAGTAGL
jgi:hypothetical protein